jgi:hypothetical protein
LDGPDSGAGVSFLVTLRKLLLGETWVLPVGLAAVVCGCLVVRHLLGEGWDQAGGFVLLAGVAVVLVLSVATSGRPHS